MFFCFFLLADLFSQSKCCLCKLYRLAFGSCCPTFIGLFWSDFFFSHLCFYFNAALSYYSFYLLLSLFCWFVFPNTSFPALFSCSWTQSVCGLILPSVSTKLIFSTQKIPHLGVGGICCGNDDFTPETQVEIIDGLGIKSHLVRVVKTSFLGSLTLFFLVCWLTWWLCGPTLSVQHAAGIKFVPYITFKAVPSRKTWGSVM